MLPVQLFSGCMILSELGGSVFDIKAYICYKIFSILIVRFK